MQCLERYSLLQKRLLTPGLDNTELLSLLSKPVVLKLCQPSEVPGSQIRISDKVDLGWSLRICTSNKLSGAADAAGPGTTHWGPLTWASLQKNYNYPKKLKFISTSFTLSSDELLLFCFECDFSWKENKTKQRKTNSKLRHTAENTGETQHDRLWNFSFSPRLHLCKSLNALPAAPVVHLHHRSNAQAASPCVLT